MGEENLLSVSDSVDYSVHKLISLSVSLLVSVSVSVIMSEINQLLEDSKSLTEFISDPASDLTVLENSNQAF